MRFRQLFQLPSPSDLGWSKSNALRSHRFSPYQEGKSWEDWREHCIQHYPVRYFLSEVLPLEIKRWLVWPVRRVVTWVLDHCVPRRRYHVMDLRKIDPLHPYRHGYLDPCEAFWLSGWGALMRWHREGRHRQDPRSWMSAEDQVSCSAQIEAYDELSALVQYWTVTRLGRAKEEDRLFEASSDIEPTPENRAIYEAAKHRWLEYYRESERLEEEMWGRLAKMRLYLWD